MDRRLGEEKQINKMMAVQETDEFVAEREREKERRKGPKHLELWSAIHVVLWKKGLEQISETNYK